MSFLNESLKICHKQKFKYLVFLQVDLTGLLSPVVQFHKNCNENAYFLTKVAFCIFEPKNREVIGHSSKAPLNSSPLLCTYLGKNSFKYL